MFSIPALPRFSILIILLVGLTMPLRAVDPSWPQFHGPDRDNKSTDKGLLKTWPPGGPERLWEVTGIGEGYSTVAVARANTPRETPPSPVSDCPSCAIRCGPRRCIRD